MAEPKTFRLLGRTSDEVMDTISKDALAKSGRSTDEISLVRHMPQHKLSVFNIRGVAVIADYSREPYMYFHMGAIKETDIESAARYIESRFSNSKLVEGLSD